MTRGRRASGRLGVANEQQQFVLMVTTVYESDNFPRMLHGKMTRCRNGRWHLFTECETGYDAYHDARAAHERARRLTSRIPDGWEWLLAFGVVIIEAARLALYFFD